MFIDNYAYKNDLSCMHPAEKLLLVITSMIIGLLTDAIANMAIFVVFLVLMLFVAKIPFKVYARLITFPIVFVALSIITAVITFSPKPGCDPIFSILGIEFGILTSGFEIAKLTFSRSLALITCTLFLSLTTPVLDIISFMKMVKIPGIIRELFLLFYKYIFILQNTAKSIYTAQRSRLGYITFKRGIISLASLMTFLFIKSLQDAEVSYTAIIARGYDGSIDTLDDDFKISFKNITFIIAIEILFIVIGLRRNIL